MTYNVFGGTLNPTLLLLVVPAIKLTIRLSSCLVLKLGTKDTASALSFSTFRRQLKDFLFWKSFRNIHIQLRDWHLLVVLVIMTIISINQSKLFRVA